MASLHQNLRRLSSRVCPIELADQQIQSYFVVNLSQYFRVLTGVLHQ